VNISFSMTTQQVRNRTKRVTRRLGWLWIVKAPKPVILQAIEKGQGLKRGEHVVKICPIRVVGARLETLKKMIWHREYGLEEVIKEGVPWMTPEYFVQWFCKGHHCTPDRVITRIEFEYMEGEDG